MRNYLNTLGPVVKLAVTTVGALVLFAATAHAQKIVKIDVVENTKTTDATVIYIADVEKGDTFTPELPGRIQKDLVSSGLFKYADAYGKPVKGGIKLTIIAKDKHSWVIAPTVYAQPTNKGAGIGFGENNLFGQNKKLLLYGQVATGDSFFIGAYVDPSIGGTRFNWQWDVFLRRERILEYASPVKWISDIKPLRQSKINYLNTGVKAGITVFRTAKLNLRLRGAHVSYSDVQLAEGAAIDEVTSDPMASPDNVPAPGAEGWDVSGEATLEFDRRANWYGISTGDSYKLSIERALPGLSSDFNYWYSSVRLYRARKYFSRHNLIVKGKFGYGKNMPFQQEYTTGGTDLRGYRGRTLRGNVRAATTVEYSVPVFLIKGFALRALAFADSTYTAFTRARTVDSRRVYLPDHNGLRLGGFRNSVGLGTRVYLRQIVLPLLGLDIGYGLERRAYEIYFAVGLTDF